MTSMPRAERTRRNHGETGSATGSRSRSNALAAFVARKAEIDTMLERLATLSAEHFNASPDEVNWGYVGTLDLYASLLRQITDAAFKEGEHAE